MRIVKIEESVSMAPFSTLRVGGSAAIAATIETRDDWAKVHALAIEKNLPIVAIGGGSNLFFPDGELRAIVAIDRNSQIEKIDESGGVRCESGTPLSLLVAETRKWGFAGVEALAGLPGRVGGAVFGNAGIPQCEIGDFVERVEIFSLRTGRFSTLEKNEISFSYRHSSFAETPKFVIVKIEFRFSPNADPQKLLERSLAWIAERKGKQPAGQSAGSFFKNPPEGAAGRFLDEAGAKKLRVGGAFFSEMHANFLMTDEGTTATDVEALAECGTALVFEKFGIRLEREVRRISLDDAVFPVQN